MMDPLDDIFAAMRVRSALYARLELSAPWGLDFAAGRMARFGLVVRGSALLRLDGAGPPLALAAGDCFVMVRGSRYVLSDAPGSATRPCSETVRDHVGGVVTLGGGGAPATAITGWFEFDALAAKPLVELIPALLLARLDDDRSRLLQATLQMLAVETGTPALGSGTVISRLADILFVHAVRSHAQAVALDEGAGASWLTAWADRRIGAALRRMHHELARAWTVDELASAAGLSRSAFAQRFRRQVGEPPLEYLTRWRMFRAGCLMRAGDAPLAGIAAQVGYDSEPAFNKAFKRVTGLPPGAWRREAAAQAQRM